MTRHVLYLAASSFRTINAGALRNVNVANALAYAGHSVEILCGDAPEDVIAEEWGSMLNPSVSLSPAGGSRSNIASRVLRVLRGPRITAAQTKAADLILAYNPGPLAFGLLRRHASRVGIPMVLDVSEWLSMRDQPGSFLSPYAWLYEAFMRRLPQLLSRAGKAIAISNGMGEHLAKAGAPVLVVPPLSNVGGREEDRSPRSDLRIVVSGSGLRRGAKDAETLYALLRLAEIDSSKLDRTSIGILGDPNQEVVLRLRQLLGPEQVVVHGWLAWEDALSVLSKADWLVLLRDPQKRRNQVGFPSKVIEAVTLGVPVLVNRCGVMDEVLTEANSIVIEGSDPVTLGRALALARGEWNVTPDRRFTSASWAEELHSFLFGGVSRR